MNILSTHASPIIEIAPHGNIDLGISVNKFFLMGFRPGDAVDVELSSGFAFRNIPVFSGFYGAGNKPCLYATTKFYPHIGIGCPVSGNPWLMANAKPGDTARIVLRRRRGFDRLEKRMRVPELLDPSPSRTPQQNANWRSLDAGRITPGAIYRSCSPVRGDVAAAAIACNMMKKTRIQSVLNLSDNAALLEDRKGDPETGAAPYLHLHDEGRVLPLHLGVDYHLQENARTLAQGLLWLAAQPKPSLIHCKLGLDRTGMVCALLEMLAGCDYARIERDYQASYFNLFGPRPKNGQSYSLGDQRFKELMDYLLSLVPGAKGCEGEPPSSETLHLAAYAYLQFGGLDETHINRIEHMLE